MTENLVETPEGKILTFDFGKNMMGLTDELILIGEKIKHLSRNYRILIREAFIDEANDVYCLKFVLFPKEEAKDYASAKQDFVNLLRTDIREAKLRENKARREKEFSIAVGKKLFFDWDYVGEEEIDNRGENKEDNNGEGKNYQGDN